VFIAKFILVDICNDFDHDMCKLPHPLLAAQQGRGFLHSARRYLTPEKA